MVAGMAVFAVGLLPGAVVQTPTGHHGRRCASARPAPPVSSINAVVVLWNLAPSCRVLGTYTGLYAVGWCVRGLRRTGPRRPGGRPHRLASGCCSTSRSWPSSPSWSSSGSTGSSAATTRGRAPCEHATHRPHHHRLPGPRRRGGPLPHRRGLHHPAPTRCGDARERDELIAILDGAEGALIASEPMTAEVLAQARALRAVVRTGVGYDSVDVAAATRRGRLGEQSARRQHQRRGRVHDRPCCWPRPAGWCRSPPVSPPAAGRARTVTSCAGRRSG